MGKHLTLLAAVALAALTVGAQALAGSDSTAPILLGLAVPVALFAIELGIAGGLLAGLAAGGLVLAWDSSSNADLAQLDLVARIAILVATGVVVGAIADQARRSEQRRREAAIEAERVKEEFFTLVSHELRTPLTSIIGYTDLLREDAKGGDPRDLRALDAISRNAQRELRLVRDMLVLVRADAGGLQVRRKPVDLVDVTETAVDNVAAIAGERDLVVDRSSLSRAAMIGADPDLIAHMLDNLLTNAIKFTPAGSKIQVSAAGGPREVTWSVSDDGYGLDADALPHAFDRLFRGQTATAEHIPGAGLGLAAVREIARAHGGDAEIEDNAPRGLTVRVRIPGDPEDTA